MRLIFNFLLCLTVLTVYSCATPQHSTQLVHHIRADTVYMKDVQYDSIYIYKDRSMDYHPSSQSRIANRESLIANDTVYVRDVSIEYRYRMLHDTIRFAHRDSIPYEVTVTETREITRPLTWFDHLTRACFWLIVGVVIAWLIKFIRNHINNLPTRRS